MLNVPPVSEWQICDWLIIVKIFYQKQRNITRSIFEKEGVGKK